jgi:hypothetical protein
MPIGIVLDRDLEPPRRLPETMCGCIASQTKLTCLLSGFCIALPTRLSWDKA